MCVGMSVEIDGRWPGKLRPRGTASARAPAQYGRVGNPDVALGHHGDQIAVAQPVRDVPQF